MNITFYGAAGGVTGSKHLVEAGDKKVLLDCGTFQGLSDVRERNRSLPFAPDTIDQVVLSHAHIDHSGMLMLLVKNGYQGKIFATKATIDVAQWMMKDMAKIERQDAKYRMKHKFGAPDSREALFTEEDVEEAVKRFEPVEYARRGGGWKQILPNVKLKFYDAGHILGSAITVLEMEEKGKVERLAYTGDLGPSGMPLLFDPQVPREEITTLITETTYGSRVHDPLTDAIEQLAVAIKRVVDRGGKIVVPAFSLGRTQVLVYLVHRLTDEGKIPRFPIYVDSPLATNLTEVHRKHREDYDEETWVDFAKPGHDPLAFRNLTYVQSSRESKELNGMPGPFMVISASGMMTAGRVVHHLKHTIEDADNAIFITGYQAQGTLGRRILEGDKSVEILGGRDQVKADVFLFNEFSAHADSRELQAFAEGIKGLKQVYLVHGEAHQADDYRAQIKEAHPEWQVVQPKEGDSFSL